eukprot:1380283-Rhodomonas_salina.1
MPGAGSGSGVNAVVGGESQCGASGVNAVVGGEMPGAGSGSGVIVYSTQSDEGSADRRAGGVWGATAHWRSPGAVTKVDRLSDTGGQSKFDSLRADTGAASC